MMKLSEVLKKLETYSCFSVQIKYGVFYSIIDPKSGAASTGYVKFTTGDNGTNTVAAQNGATVTVDGSSSTLTIAKGAAARVVATKDGTVVYDSVVSA